MSQRTQQLLHAVGIGVTMVMVVLASLGVIPMWLVTFGLDWHATVALLIGLLAVSWLLGILVGRRA